MGVDIHLVVTIKKDNKWRPIEEIPNAFDCRNYELFDFLCDIGENGIPEEVVGKKLRKKYENEEYEYYEYDATADYLYGHAYIILEDLIKEESKLNKVTVSKEFLDIFFVLGGVLPKGMSVDNEDDGIYVEPLDEYERATRETIKTGIEELRKIASKYNVKEDEIKLVYAFDC